MHQPPKPTDSQNLALPAAAPLIAASFPERKLDELVKTEFLKVATADQLGVLTARLIPTSALCSPFVDSATDLWFSEEHVRGDFRLRLLRAFDSQFSRYVFSDYDTLAAGIAPLSEIFCRTCQDSKVLESPEESWALLEVAGRLVQYASRITDPFTLEWDMKEYLATLKSIEVAVRMLSPQIREQSTELYSLQTFLTSRASLSPDPTLESLEVLKIVWTVGDLLRSPTFRIPLVPGLKSLVDLSDSFSEVGIYKRFGTVTRAQREFADSLHALIRQGLSHISFEADRNAPIPLLLKVIHAAEPDSVEMTLALPRLYFHDPQVAQPFIEKALLSISKGKKVWREPLLEILALEGGGPEVVSILFRMSPTPRLECFDRLDQYLNEIERELSERNYSQDWLGHLAPAVSALRTILRRRI